VAPQLAINLAGVEKEHASAESHPANRRDFFNTHAWFRQLCLFISVELHTAVRINVTL